MGITSGLEAQIDGATSKGDVLNVVAIGVDGTGQEVYFKTSGQTSLKATETKPVSRDSIFRLASCTKLMTSVAALRLVQHGKLSLDDPNSIEQHLPELWGLEVLNSTWDNDFTCKKREKPLTLRHLLTHSSGVGYDIADQRLQAWRKNRNERPLALRGPIVEAFSTPLLFEPGEGWAYGGGLDWIGLLIERVSGKSFGKYLRDDVFDVVGCDERIDFLEQLQEKGLEKDIVMVATRVEDGKGGHLKEWKIGPQKAELGGGGLLSSPSNYVKVMADLISAGPKILEKEYADMLFTPQLDESSKALKDLRASSPAFSSMTGALTGKLDTTSINHALGGLLVVEDNEAVGKTGGTMAWGGAFSCLEFLNREQGVAGFYASSMFPPAKGTSRELMAGFVETLWGKIS